MGAGVSRRSGGACGTVLGRAAGFVLRLGLALAIGLVALWGALALWYRLPAPEAARYGAAGLFALFGLTTIVALFSRSRTVGLVYSSPFSAIDFVVEHD